MRTKYKHRFDRVVFNNRWLQKYPPDNYTIFGLSKFWFSSLEYEWRLSFFGLEMRIWIKREFIKTK